MKLHELRPNPGATHKRKRVGRGSGSGHGTTAGRGTKGQKSRSGGQVHPRFEGGQLPLVKRMPYKRGFKNIFRIEYAEVNVGSLADFPAGSRIDAVALATAGIIRSPMLPVKVLGDGEISQPLTVVANKFSANAKAKLLAAGGEIVEIGGPKEQQEEQMTETKDVSGEEA